MHRKINRIRGAREGIHMLIYLHFLLRNQIGWEKNKIDFSWWLVGKFRGRLVPAIICSTARMTPRQRSISRTAATSESKSTDGCTDAKIHLLWRRCRCGAGSMQMHGCTVGGRHHCLYPPATPGRLAPASTGCSGWGEAYWWESLRRRIVGACQIEPVSVGGRRPKQSTAEGGSRKFLFGKRNLGNRLARSW